MLIAQLSDPRIRPAGELYQGVVDSNAMFVAAARHLNGLDPRPDVVLISGDIVDHGSAAEYANARALLAALAIPYLVIPGNHDDRAAFRAAFADQRYLPRGDGPCHYAVGEHGPVRIIALDVTIPGKHHGVIDDAALAWLDATLSTEPDRPTMLMLHQPPFATGIPYMDPYWCEGGDGLAALTRRFTNVERITCGHVHRFMQLRFGGTALCTAPSTTTAIALRLQPDAQPASHVEPPAFLLHHWRPGTGLLTHFCPIGTFPGPYPFA
jgi:3',5'-cyclic-AMP phosphodiesterase